MNSRIDAEYALVEKRMTTIRDREAEIRNSLTKSLGKSALEESQRSLESLEKEVHGLEVNLEVFRTLRTNFDASLVQKSQVDQQCYVCQKEFTDEDYQTQIRRFESKRKTPINDETLTQQKLESSRQRLDILQANKQILEELDRLTQEKAKLEKDEERYNTELGKVTRRLNKTSIELDEYIIKERALRELQLILHKILISQTSLKNADINKLGFSVEEFESERQVELKDEDDILNKVDDCKLNIIELNRTMQDLGEKRSSLQSDVDLIVIDMEKIASKSLQFTSIQSVKDELKGLEETMTELDQRKS